MRASVVILSILAAAAVALGGCDSEPLSYELSGDYNRSACTDPLTTDDFPHVSVLRPLGEGSNETWIVRLRRDAATTGKKQEITLRLRPALAAPDGSQPLVANDGVDDAGEPAVSDAAWRIDSACGAEAGGGVNGTASLVHRDGAWEIVGDGSGEDVIAGGTLTRLHLALRVDDADLPRGSTFEATAPPRDWRPR